MKIECAPRFGRPYAFVVGLVLLIGACGWESRTQNARDTGPPTAQGAPGGEICESSRACRSGECLDLETGNSVVEGDGRSGICCEVSDCGSLCDIVKSRKGEYSTDCEDLADQGTSSSNDNNSTDLIHDFCEIDELATPDRPCGHCREEHCCDSIRRCYQDASCRDCLLGTEEESVCDNEPDYQRSVGCMRRNCVDACDVEPCPTTTFTGCDKPDTRCRTTSRPEIPAGYCSDEPLQCEVDLEPDGTSCGDGMICQNGECIRCPAYGDSCNSTAVGLCEVGRIRCPEGTAKCVDEKAPVGTPCKLSSGASGTCNSRGACSANCTCTGRCGSFSGCSCGGCPSGQKCDSNHNCVKDGSSNNNNNNTCKNYFDSCITFKWGNQVGYCKNNNIGTKDSIPVVRNDCNGKLVCKGCAKYNGRISSSHCMKWTLSPGETQGGWADTTWCDIDGSSWQCVDARKSDCVRALRNWP